MPSNGPLGGNESLVQHGAHVRQRANCPSKLTQSKNGVELKHIVVSQKPRDCPHDSMYDNLKE